MIGGVGGDTIDAGDGRNVVLGDDGRVTAAATDGPAWSQVPMTIGRVETTDSEVGGRDDITTGTGVDVVLGGADGDTVHAGSEPPAVGTASGTGDIVLGDNGFLVWAAVRLPGSSTTTRQVVTLTTVDDAIGGADTDLRPGRRGRAGRRHPRRHASTAGPAATSSSATTSALDRVHDVRQLHATRGSGR